MNEKISKLRKEVENCYNQLMNGNTAVLSRYRELTIKLTQFEFQNDLEDFFSVFEWHDKISCLGDIEDIIDFCEKYNLPLKRAIKFPIQDQFEEYDLSEDIKNRIMRLK